jgi:glycosyltransferase involved in cell wall biosynthesis
VANELLRYDRNDMSKGVPQITPVSQQCSPTVLMLLTNAYDPDPRVRQEALTLIDLGCRVRLLAWDRERKAAPTALMEGVHVQRVFLSSTHGRGNLQMLFYAALYLRMLWRGLRTQFDVVHCHDLDTLPLGYVLGKLKAKPVVYDAHESFTDMLEGSVHPFLQNALWRLENVLIHRVDLLITVGETLRRHFVQRGAQRSAVIGNWKRLGEFSRTAQQSAAVRRRLQIPDDALVVVCITQLLKDRKLEELLDAVQDSPDVFVIIGGKGSLEPYIVERASRNSRIRYVGFVQGADIPAYTCAADVVYYGFDSSNPNAKYSAPNKLFEALAAGKPLITGDFGEIADMVRRAGCGIVLPEYSPEHIRGALQQMMDTRSRQQLAANAGRMGRTAVNWEKAEMTLYDEYSQLLKTALRRPSHSVQTSVNTPAGA